MKSSPLQVTRLSRTSLKRPHPNLLMSLNQHTVGGEYLVNAHDAQQIPTTPLKVNKGSLKDTLTV